MPPAPSPHSMCILSRAENRLLVLKDLVNIVSMDRPSQSSVSSCSLLLWAKQTGSEESWYCWGSWEQGNCQLWQISTHRAARLRLRGTADICSPRKCLDARLGSRRARRERGLGESFLVENQETAFSWGTEPLLGVGCHPHLAAGEHGCKRPIWTGTVSDDKG